MEKEMFLQKEWKTKHKYEILAIFVPTHPWSLVCKRIFIITQVIVMIWWKWSIIRVWQLNISWRCEENGWNVWNMSEDSLNYTASGDYCPADPPASQQISGLSTNIVSWDTKFHWYISCYLNWSYHLSYPSNEW